MIARWTQRYPRWTWLAAVAILLALDQVTKTYFSTTLKLGQGIAVTEWFNLVHVLNMGAAFSFLADAGGWQRWFFICASVLVVGVVAVMCLGQKAATSDRWVGAFVAGGGGGNLVDRIQTGAVVDFIDLHWRGMHWPAFNFADIFLVCAMLVWFFLSLKSTTREHADQKPAELPR